MSVTRSFTIELPADLAAQMPKEQAERQQIIQLGLKQLRIQKALKEYQQGGCSLAYAAKQAEVSIREMIPLAYAYGLEPGVDPDWLASELPPEQAAQL